MSGIKGLGRDEDKQSDRAPVYTLYAETQEELQVRREGARVRSIILMVHH